MLNAAAITLGAFTAAFAVLWLADVFAPADLAVVAVCDATVGVLLLLAALGKWRLAGYALPALFLLLASYLTYLVGLWSAAFAFFILPVTLGFALLGGSAEWIILALSLLLYAGAGWLHGDRLFADIVGTVLSVAAPLAGTVILLRFARVRLRTALDASTATASRLAEQVAIRRSAEETMRDIAERSRAVFQSIEDGIILTDLQGRIVDLNPSAVRMLGAPSPEALVGTKALAAVHDDDSGPARQAILRVLGGQSEGILQFHLRRRDGGTFPAQSSIVLFRDAAGQPAGYVSVFRDATQQTALDAQLRQAQKMQAVGQFAGGVAHDFNNLLLAIRGYAELGLQDLPLENGVRDYLTEVLNAADRAGALVRQLLAFSRSEAIRPRPIDLNAAVTGLTGMLSRVIGEHVRLDTALGPELQPVLADPGQIEQILVNLSE